MGQYLVPPFLAQTIKDYRPKTIKFQKYHFQIPIPIPPENNQKKVKYRYGTGKSRTLPSGRAALLRKRECEASPPAAVALANGLLNSLGARAGTHGSRPGGAWARHMWYLLNRLGDPPVRHKKAKGDGDRMPRRSGTRALS